MYVRTFTNRSRYPQIYVALYIHVKQPCPPGTYWNESTQTTSCLGCPVGQTSLLGATACFTPCPPNSALNTTDLTCVPIPAVVNETLSDLGLTNVTIAGVFVVEESASLGDTLGFLTTVPPGSTIVLTVNPGVYPTYPEELDVNLIIVGVPEEEGGRRQRRLQTTGPTIIYAPDNARHFSTTRLLSLSGVILQGSVNSATISGGVQLTVRGWVGWWGIEGWIGFWGRRG